MKRRELTSRAQPVGCRPRVACSLRGRRVTRLAQRGARPGPCRLSYTRVRVDRSVGKRSGAHQTSCIHTHPRPRLRAAMEADDGDDYGPSGAMELGDGGGGGGTPRPDPATPARLGGSLATAYAAARTAVFGGSDAGSNGTPAPPAAPPPAQAVLQQRSRLRRPSTSTSALSPVAAHTAGAAAPGGEVGAGRRVWPASAAAALESPRSAVSAARAGSGAARQAALARAQGYAATPPSTTTNLQPVRARTRSPATATAAKGVASGTAPLLRTAPSPARSRLVSPSRAAAGDGALRPPTPAAAAATHNAAALAAKVAAQAVELAEITTRAAGAEVRACTGAPVSAAHVSTCDRARLAHCPTPSPTHAPKPPHPTLPRRRTCTCSSAGC